jgi:hypothetical protein
MAELLWKMQNWAEKVQFQAKFGSKKKKPKSSGKSENWLKFGKFQPNSV